MQLVRKLALCVATVSVAFGAGHLVQSGNDTNAQGETVVGITGAAQAGDGALATTRPERILASQAGLGFPDSLVGAVDKILKPRPRPAYLTVVRADAGAAASATSAGSAADQPSTTASEGCAPALTVTPLGSAMLDVTLFAPCDREARVILRHAGLALAAHTTATGELAVRLPALDRAGKVSAMLEDGTGTEGAAPVEMTGIRRFAVQWLADDAIQLQIYENGAAFGAPGNVSAARPRGAGFLVALGDPRVDLPLMSEIYTYPAAAIPVEVTLEAEVTEANCGREILGQALESMDGVVKTRDIALTIPGCEAKGNILVLNNLVGDTTLAQAE